MFLQIDKYYIKIIFADYDEFKFICSKFEELIKYFYFCYAK